MPRFSLLLALWLASFSPANAALLDIAKAGKSLQEGVSAPAGRESVLLFGGAFTSVDLRNSLPWRVPPSSGEVFLGAAYSRNWHRLPLNFVLGWELGGGYRFGGGSASSAEAWAGLRVEYVGLPLGDFTIVPAMTAGFSLISERLAIESMREQIHSGSARFLGYLGPELSFRLNRQPNIDLVYRLHHRSGAGGLFGGMREGANANTIGIRIRF